MGSGKWSGALLGLGIREEMMGACMKIQKVEGKGVERRMWKDMTGGRGKNWQVMVTHGCECGERREEHREHRGCRAVSGKSGWAGQLEVETSQEDISQGKVQLKCTADLNWRAVLWMERSELELTSCIRS